MKRRTLFSIIVITLTAGFFTLFYGMHSTWTDTRSAQAVQAATDQVNDLFKDQSHQLPSDQLNKQAIAAAETKLNRLVRRPMMQTTLPHLPAHKPMLMPLNIC